MNTYLQLPYSSNQISFIELQSCKNYYKRPSGVVRVCGKGQLDVRFYVGQCVLREWIVGGDGLYGYFWEQGRHWASRSVLKDFAEDA